MHIMDNFLIYYLQRFDKYCFDVVLHGHTYTIGTGEPLFRVLVHKDIPKKELLTSTSLALGEAYMRGGFVCCLKVHPQTDRPVFSRPVGCQQSSVSVGRQNDAARRSMLSL